MERITIKHLKYQCEELNELLNLPLTPYSEIDGNFAANVGNFHISRAYGGFCLHQMHNINGGVTSPLSYGHVPARELYNSMRAYIAGIREGLNHESN